MEIPDHATISAFLKLLVPVSFCVLACAATTDDRVVRGVSSSVVDQVTTITIDVSQDFEYKTGRLHDPERVYFDILQAQPASNSSGSYSQGSDSPIVRRIRVAETAPHVTRVVLDLSLPADISISKSTSPSQLRIALRSPRAKGENPLAAPLSSIPNREAPAEQQLPGSAAVEPVRTPPVVSSNPGLTVSISPQSVAPGGAAVIVISLDSSTLNEPITLQWQMSYPSPEIGIDDDQITLDPAAESSGKSVTCSGKAVGPGTYIYSCTIAGGSKPIPGGRIALIPLQVRHTARTGTATIALTNIGTVSGGGQTAPLPDVETSLDIR
jgi:hypothetical protein